MNYADIRLLHSSETLTEKQFVISLNVIIMAHMLKYKDFFPHFADS